MLEETVDEEPYATGALLGRDELELAGETKFELATEPLDEAAEALLVSDELETTIVTAVGLMRGVEIDPTVAPTDVATELWEP